MKVVLDTNVILSAFYFGGLPGDILEAWRDSRFELVLSAPILAEYVEAAAAFEAKYGAKGDFDAFASLLVLHSEIIDAPEYLEPAVCSDQDDDKFLACAAAAGAMVVVSGDRALRDVSGWQGVDVVSPREFSNRYLADSA